MRNTEKNSSLRRSEESGMPPTIRFPEFREYDPWKRKRLGEIADFVPGFGFPKKYQGKAEGEFPFYKVSDISNSLQAGEHKISRSANYVDQDDLKELRAKLTPVGATIFARIGEAIRLNRRAITTVPCVIDNNVGGLKRIEGRSTDLFVYYIALRIALADHSGGAVPSVNKSTIEQIPIFCPEIEEQKKIAGCLSSIDDLIVTECKKLAALKDHKAGLMQQLFPVDDETLPKLRFSEFQSSSEWEVKPLADIIQTIVPPRKIQTKDYLPEGRVPIIDQSQKKIAGWTNDSGAEIHDTSPLIVFGDHTCELKFIEKPFAQGADGIKILKGSPVIDEKFLFFFLQARPVNTGQYKRHFSILKELKVSFPKIETGEQKKISDCLSSASKSIEDQQARIDLLRQHQRGLLQKLFPTVDEVQV